jgi:outer membrane protein assembly factor BamB
VLALSLFAPPARAQMSDSQRSMLTGYWKAQLECEGSRSWFALELVAADSGRVHARMTLPAIRGYDYDIGEVRLARDSLFAGPFAFAWDSAGGRLRGVMPRAVVPVHELAVSLERGTPLAREPRPPLTTQVRAPAWTFDAHSPLWADLEAGSGLVYAGGDDGVLHALDVSSGRERWRFRTHGRLRARPTLLASSLYVQSDDGWLYRLDAAKGTQRWRVRIMPDSIVRVPIDQPGSKYDFYASAVTAAYGALYVGTHEGRVLALDPATGGTLWEANAGGAVLAAPGVDGGRVFVGSFTGEVVAFDANDGRLLWKHDTGAPVTSTPVPDQGVVVVGSRSYDLLGLDAETGAVRWDIYVWFSWIESSARVVNGVAYIGSSDASRIYALVVKTGTLRWEADVHGISWGRPALSADRVYAAVRYSPSIEAHEANLVALDRASGEPLWRYPCDRPAGATHRGFAASPVVYKSHVMVGGLDGVVYAFPVNDPHPRHASPK